MSNRAAPLAAAGLRLELEPGAGPVLAALLLVAVGGGLAVGLSALSLLSLALDGGLALLLVATAAGWGAWPATLLRGGRPSCAADLGLAVALGLGLTSVYTLVIGVTGVLHRELALGWLIGGVLLGLVWVVGHRNVIDAPLFRFTGGSKLQPLWWSAALLPLAIPLGVACAGAVLPPGTLWFDEARGYDALEYHLQAPREWFELGRITFLPHNVYASFPQQMEMLYLFLMVVLGDAHAAAVPGQCLHAAMAGLAVVVVGSSVRRITGSGWSAALAATFCGCVPWLAYVGVLAYVECGMLLFAAVSTALLLGCLRETAPPTRTLLAAGLCAGLAAGCKYTAIVLIVIGLALGWLATSVAPRKRRWMTTLVFVGAAVASFSPWIARNLAFTGNPLYPFAYELFGGRDWSAQQAEQWRRGHRVTPAHDSISGRLGLACEELIGRRVDRIGGPPAFVPALFGSASWVAVLAAALLAMRGARRELALCGAWSAVILAAWVSLTHLPGRFAIPLVIPMGLTVGLGVGCAGGSAAKTGGSRAADGFRRGASPAADRADAVTRTAAALWPRVALGALVWIVAAINGLQLLGLFRAHERYYGTGAFGALAGATRAFAESHWLNRALPDDARVWLLGDAACYYIDRPVHYTVVFNRDPWIDYCSAATPAASVQWLRARGYTHVAIVWPEVERLRATYGFAPLVTRAWVDSLREAGLSVAPSASEEALPAGVELLRVEPGP